MWTRNAGWRRWAEAPGTRQQGLSNVRRTSRNDSNVRWLDVRLLGLRLYSLGHVAGIGWLGSFAFQSDSVGRVIRWNCGVPRLFYVT